MSDDETFELEIPPGSFPLFDASQSTLIIKNAAGHTLFALKNVHHYRVDSVAVTWNTKVERENLSEELEAVRKKMTELQSQLEFTETLNG